MHRPEFYLQEICLMSMNIYKNYLLYPSVNKIILLKLLRLLQVLLSHFTEKRDISVSQQ